MDDAASVLNFLFAGGAAPDTRTRPDRTTMPVRTLNFLFPGAVPPPALGAFECGGDSTIDELEPCNQPICR